MGSFFFPKISEVTFLKIEAVREALMRLPQLCKPKLAEASKRAVAASARKSKRLKSKPVDSAGCVFQ